ncbi:MAG: DUF3696 domain-containing protein [Pseudonocardiaceae bacterium]
MPQSHSTRLVGLELKNFKSVRQADITIGALTVIVGANSTGKSSILQALLAMSQVTRRRIDGHRSALNDEFARLGTFEAVRHQHYDLAENLAFTGTVRSADSETAVLDALISSGQVGTLFGTPPAAPVRVRDWFSAVADRPRLEHPTEPGAPEISRQQVEREVLEGFEAELSMRREASTVDAEPLEGLGPARLGDAQRACARYLATQVRYVGPLRHPPYRPFPSAPDPDRGEVGIEGEYVASVLQTHRGTKRRYPVPGDAKEELFLLDAVKRWMVHFGLAEDLKVREDTPLVLGIDIIPPGLERAVTLSAVGVGVSQVVPVIVQCLVAGPGALVVLEQPELHLHPAAQQCLADFLLACMAWGQNLLVESHSEYLVLRLRRRIAEDQTDRLKDDLVLLFASRDHDGETMYQPIELTDTGALVEWPDGFFDQGSDEAHQLLIASAAKRRQAGGRD